VPLTLAEYIEELRQKHPTLFKARRAEPMPAVAAPLVTAAPAISEPSVNEPHEGGARRDWLDLGGSAEVAAAPLAKPRLAGAAKARFGSVLQAGASALAAVRPAIFQAMGRIRPASARRPGPTAESVPPMASVVRPRRWLPVAGAAAAFGALLVGSALVIPGLMNPGDAPDRQMASAPATAAPPADPVSTGTVAQNSPPPASGSLRGVPEVLDTTTLRLQDRVVRLFGVEWARGGGDPDDLVKYLRGREVSCAPAATAESFRCQVEGQDLSRVVLFNGGGRATSDATPELRTAEEHARSARLGVWRESRAPGP
jgi:endonuclease YncB( thermonuclease family)